MPKRATPDGRAKEIEEMEVLRRQRQIGSSRTLEVVDEEIVTDVRWIHVNGAQWLVAL
jgi:hypothetical protein